MPILFVVMYAIMFINVDDVNHIYLSLNRCYMALVMVAAMSIIMILFMAGIYPNKMVNGGVIAARITVFVTALICLRTLAFISDRQYVRV